MRNFLFLIVLLLGACSNGNQKTPAGVIPKDQMISVLTDVHLVEAATTFKSMGGESPKDYAGPQYESVFQLHRTNRAQFVKSLKYYTSEPKELEEMYDEVITELSKRQATGGK
jgi:hypothetical protein